MTSRASSVTRMLYAQGAEGGRSRATSAADTGPRLVGGEAGSGTATSPPRPDATATTPARMTTATTSMRTGTVLIVPCPAGRVAIERAVSRPVRGANPDD